MGGKLRLCFALVLLGSLSAATLVGSPATAGDPPSGVVLSGVDADIGYFLALNAVDEESFSKDGSDFDVFDKATDGRLSGPDGVAQSRARQDSTVITGTGDPENGFNLIAASSLGNVSGYTNASAAKEGVPVADAYSDFNLDFSVNDVSVPYTLVVSSSVHNSDDDDCSELEVALSGETTLYRHSVNAGGDCGSPPPDIRPTSGVLQPGSYSLSYELYGASAADYSSARYDGSVLVEIRFYQPCTHTGSEDADVPLNGTNGSDIICAFGGDDEIDGKGGTDIIIAGTGDDEIKGGGGADEIFGDQGADRIVGGNGSDLIAGGDDQDVINGGDNNDKLYGGNHKDKLKGGPAKDTMTGDAGNDVLEGDEGNDRGDGGVGNDTLRGGGGEDTLNGNDNDDLLLGGGAKDFLGGGKHNDEIRAKDGTADKVRGAAGTDKAEVDKKLDNVTGIENFI